MSIELDCKCSKCGYRLSSAIKAGPYGSDIHIEITLDCKCLERARKEASAEGYDEGHQAGEEARE